MSLQPPFDPDLLLQPRPSQCWLCVALHDINTTPRWDYFLGKSGHTRQFISCERGQKNRQIQSRAHFGDSLWFLACIPLTASQSLH